MNKRLLVFSLIVMLTGCSPPKLLEVDEYKGEGYTSRISYYDQYLEVDISTKDEGYYEPIVTQLINPENDEIVYEKKDRCIKHFCLAKRFSYEEIPKGKFRGIVKLENGTFAKFELENKIKP
ncbi:hypothetical protein WKH57_01305 [Niallia taxi]|uniref:hypothetical protein n=1 Tax=Niallia taxi TaxID=2499688 RepID=UPI003177F725